MACLIATLVFASAAFGCPAYGLSHAAIFSSNPTIDQAGAGPARPLRIAARRSHESEGKRATEQAGKVDILGKWCNDHKEIWVFGKNTLTHRQPDNTHTHRVRYFFKSGRITVYVDGYPDDFRALTPDGSRMKLHSSGLDSSMNGWIFWRCPDLLSVNHITT